MKKKIEKKSTRRTGSMILHGQIWNAYYLFVYFISFRFLSCLFVCYFLFANLSLKIEIILLLEPLLLNHKEYFRKILSSFSTAV